MNQHQVRKLIKIVSKMGPKMAIKLFVYTLSKTTANCRMVSKNSAAFFLLPIMSCVRWQCLNLFPLQWLPKQFTQDYLSNYMIGGHAKVKVFLPEHDDYLDVFMKTVKDGRSAITRGWTRVVRAFCMEEGTIWAFRFTLFSNQNIFASFFIVFNSTSIQLWFTILYLVLMQFLNICTYESNNALVVWTWWIWIKL